MNFVYSCRNEISAKFRLKRRTQNEVALEDGPKRVGRGSWMTMLDGIRICGLRATMAFSEGNQEDEDGIERERNSRYWNETPNSSRNTSTSRTKRVQINILYMLEAEQSCLLRFFLFYSIVAVRRSSSDL